MATLWCHFPGFERPFKILIWDFLWKVSAKPIFKSPYDQLYNLSKFIATRLKLYKLVLIWLHLVELRIIFKCFSGFWVLVLHLLPKIHFPDSSLLLCCIIVKSNWIIKRTFNLFSQAYHNNLSLNEDQMSHDVQSENHVGWERHCLNNSLKPGWKGPY